MSDTEKALLDFITAIRDALDIPIAAAGEVNRQAEGRLREGRARDVSAHINVFLSRGDGVSPEILTGMLRERIAESPVTYRPYEPVPDAQDSPEGVSVR